MRTSDAAAVKSAGRALDLLELIAGAAAPLSFGTIAEALEVPASSLSQLLATLTERGYIAHVAQRGGYRAGPAFDRLLARLWRGRGLVAQAHPLLVMLSEAIGESAGLNILRGDATEVADAVHAERELSYRIRIGATAPLHVVAGGKAFLAALPEDEIAAYMARARFVALTPATIVAEDALWRDLAEVRRSGFAESREEAAQGVVGVATLLLRHGRPLAALTIGLPALRYDAAMEIRIRELLTLAAERFAVASERGEAAEMPPAPNKPVAGR